MFHACLSPFRYAALPLLTACIMWRCAFGMAHASEEQQPQWAYTMGVDMWRLDPSVRTNTEPGFIDENANLVLPNADTAWRFRNTSPFVTLMGSGHITNQTSWSFRAKAEQTQGLRVDEAMLEHHMSPSLGLRAGVLNYKTSWCRTYEPDNGWMREVETICVTQHFRDVTGSAPGMQLFTNTMWKDYLVQSQIGFYRPLAFHYAPQEFGNLIPSPGFIVERNNKTGFNINALNLQTALEARLSYIHADQKAFLPESEIRGDSPQQSDMWYWGLSVPITPTLSVRATRLLQNQYASCSSAVSVIEGDCNLALTLKKRATALELAYRVSAIDLFSVGVSKTTFNISQSLYTPSADPLIVLASRFHSDTHQLSAAWRHDWQKGLFSVVQIILAQQNTKFMDLDYPSHGNALGMRLGYTF